MASLVLPRHQGMFSGSIRGADNTWTCGNSMLIPTEADTLHRNPAVDQA